MEETQIERPEEPGLRRANWFALLAFVLAATSLITPWWGLNATLDGVSGDLVEPVWLWDQTGEVARVWAQWLTIALLALAILVLFFRVAASSWRHEPARFRRDMGRSTLVLLAACASCWLWPVEFPFWGSRSYVDNVTGNPSLVSGAPHVGWEIAVVAMLAAAVAWWLSKPGKPSV